MNYILKLTAVCIVCAVLSLALKKQNPELAVLLGIAGAIGCVWGALSLFETMSRQFEQWQTQFGFSGVVFTPLLKCLGIAVVSQFGVGICKDAGQSAAASGLELCGNIASAGCLLPVINYLFGMIGDML